MNRVETASGSFPDGCANRPFRLAQPNRTLYFLRGLLTFSGKVTLHLLILLWLSVVNPPSETGIPPRQPLPKKFNSRLVVPIPKSPEVHDFFGNAHATNRGNTLSHSDLSVLDTFAFLPMIAAAVTWSTLLASEWFLDTATPRHDREFSTKTLTNRLTLPDGYNSLKSKFADGA